MNRAVVDTTIIADALLKVESSRDRALNALKRYEVTDLPVYALKEFKAGALRGFVWMHNQFAEQKSYQGAIRKLHALATSLQRNLSLTALEALEKAQEGIGNLDLKTIETKYGKPGITHDAIMCDAYRLQLKTKIGLAWNKRRSITTNVIQPLDCYDEASPVFNEIISITPFGCEKGKMCCVQKYMTKDLEQLKVIKRAIEAQPPKDENKRRIKALDQIIKHPDKPIDDKTCRSIGDAAFVSYTPPDSVILTTNSKDFEPMAKSISRTVEVP